MDTTSIAKRVHELYWNAQTNCTKSMLVCLGELFDVELDPHAFHATSGLLGAASFGLQCGLVEGVLMFIGIYYTQLGIEEDAILSSCCHFMETFSQKFGSLKCCELRSDLNIKKDPRYICEQLTGDAVSYAHYFIRKENAQ